MEDADSKELSLWAPQAGRELRKLPELRDVATDQQNGGLEADWYRSRHCVAPGIPPQAIDDTLYDAFGQRQVSTIFTQLNQYHVVLEVEPQFAQEPRIAQEHLTCTPADGTQVAARRLQPFRRLRTRRSRSITRDSSRRSRCRSIWRRSVAGRRDARRSTRREKEISCPPSIQTSFQGTAAAFQNSLSNEPLLILAAIVTVYIVLGVLYESYIHP